MPVLTDKDRQYLQTTHEFDVALSIGHPGRHRQTSTIPAEEIHGRRGVWLPLLVGKTTAEMQRSGSFSGMTEQQLEVWLWAMAHPALGITAGPDGRWGFENGDYEIPDRLVDDVQWWRRTLTPRTYPDSPGSAPHLRLLAQTVEDFDHVDIDADLRLRD